MTKNNIAALKEEALDSVQGGSIAVMIGVLIGTTIANTALVGVAAHLLAKN